MLRLADLAQPRGWVPYVVVPPSRRPSAVAAAWHCAAAVMTDDPAGQLFVLIAPSTKAPAAKRAAGFGARQECRICSTLLQACRIPGQEVIVIRANRKRTFSERVLEQVGGWVRQVCVVVGVGWRDSIAH